MSAAAETKLRKSAAVAKAAKAVRTRRPDGATWEAVQDIPGITYRKFDHWCRSGYVRVTIEGAGGPGRWRTLSAREVRVVALMTELVGLGLAPKAAEPVARALACGQIGSLGGFQIVRGH